VAVVTRQGSLEEAWVDIGVDDLTKYRIVEYLYQCDGDGAELASLASSLGFHSLEQTVSTAEELYGSGLLWLEWESGIPHRCGLTADPACRVTLRELYVAGRIPGATPQLVARLARRSLERVRVLRRGRVARPVFRGFRSAGLG